MPQYSLSGTKPRTIIMAPLSSQLPGYDQVLSYPTQPQVVSAMGNLLSDPDASRAGRQPMTLARYLGKSDGISVNAASITIEMPLIEVGRSERVPIGVFRYKDPGGMAWDDYLNDRYKDVRIFRATELLGLQSCVAVAQDFPTWGATATEWWSDFLPVQDLLKNAAVVSELQNNAATQLMQQFALGSIWNYVFGNIDGHHYNADNGGLNSQGKFLFIDWGAALNEPSEMFKPWKYDGLVYRADKDRGMPSQARPVQWSNVSSELQVALRSLADGRDFYDFQQLKSQFTPLQWSGVQERARKTIQKLSGIQMLPRD